LSACGSAGPNLSTMMNSQTFAADKFEMVNVDSQVIDRLAKVPSPTLNAKFGDYRRPPTLLLGAGDGVVVTLWETGSSGVFASAGNTYPGSSQSAHGVTIPEQVVAEDGTIQIPYVGRVKVANSTPRRVEEIIVGSLKGKSMDPQAVVQVSKNVTNAATVTGDVTGGGVIPLSPKGSRILEVIAYAGGLRVPAYETFVTLSRHNVMATVPFARISMDPSENVYVHPGDILNVFRKPQIFTVFGATGRNSKFSFDRFEVNLASALGAAGGLLDNRADPSAVFVLRHETAGFVEDIHPESRLAQAGQSVPVIYRIDFSQPSGYVNAQSFQMRDGDMVYVSDAPGAEVQKFLQIVGSATGPATAGATIYAGAP
ncbi:polysaccharide biosynthesis/export family protein, partial [Bradyrhizobium sp.]|uniref:polysaccharide biosynthesis/export family protein n=1 Tax=Bradyrhizobium sp. TaxID=376 RepID=UPI0025C1FFD3